MAGSRLLLTLAVNGRNAAVLSARRQVLVELAPSPTTAPGCFCGAWRSKR